MRLRAFVLAAALGFPALATAAAQDSTSLPRRLDPVTLAAVRALIDSARADSIPSKPFVDRALEGTAKHVPPARIVLALHQLAVELGEARRLLRVGAPRAAIAGDEIVAAADARRRGVPARDVSALRHDVSVSTSLVVPLTVLSDLVQRGIPADQARAVVEQLIAAGVSAQQMADIPTRMDVGLRVGAPPLEALRGASPIPLRPAGPPRGRGGGSPPPSPVSLPTSSHIH